MMLSKYRVVGLTVLASLVGSLGLTGCAKRSSDVEMGFKQVQLHWNAKSLSAENAAIKDSCEILITSRIMTDRVVLTSKVPDLLYEVFYDLDNAGALTYNGVCGVGIKTDLPECSWELKCGAGVETVVKFHNEQ